MSKGFMMADGDVVIDKDIQIARDDELLRQTVELVICTNQGEWFGDLQEGIDRSLLLRKNPDSDEIRGTIEEAALRVNKALIMTYFDLSVDNKRHATITTRWKKAGGNEVEVTYTYGN